MLQSILLAWYRPALLDGWYQCSGYPRSTEDSEHQRPDWNLFLGLDADDRSMELHVFCLEVEAVRRGGY